jgi:hypothetical protein
MPALPPAPNISFETTDAFGWSGFAAKLEAFLLTETEFVDGSLVASLNAPFGSGKTTFLRMWKDHLDSRRESGEDAPLCVLLNAWEDDYCGDPLLSLVDAIERELSEHTPDKKTEKRLGSVKEATRDLGWFMAGMANSAVSHWTGLDAVAAGEYAEAKKAVRAGEQTGPDVLSLFQARKGALQRLKGSLRSLFDDNTKPAFVLVDELDRCRPDFAIQYLETIKHVFDVEGIAFVLAVDLMQLENSARALFGDGLNFPEYYRKFAHRNIRLPSPDQAGIRNLVTKYTDRYLDDPVAESPRRKTLLNLENTRRALTELPYDFRLTPRQIQEAFRVLGHMTSVREKKSGDLYYHIANAVIFLTFLSLWKPELFHEFQSGKVSLERMLEIVSKLPISKNLDWWAFVLTLSLDQDEEKLAIEDLHAAFVKYNFVSKETTIEQFRKHLGGFSSGGFSGRLSLSALAKKIQEVERFGQ